MEIKIILGVLIIFMQGEFSHIQAGDIEKSRSMILEEQEGGAVRNIFKRSAQSNSIKKSCKSCGLSFPLSEHVIGGYDVDPPYKYPWMVNLKIVNKTENITFCTGSLISENVIMTAAHCIIKDAEKYELFKPLKGKMEFLSTKDIEVGLTTKTSKVRRGPSVQEVIPHPGFSFSHMKHDIALLKLKGKIDCNEFQNPVCLPPVDYELPEGTWLHIAGWGATMMDGVPSEVLKEAKVKTLNFKRCAEKKFPTYYKDHYICLQNNQKQSIHRGDSGCPVFNTKDLFKDGRSYVLGVASQEKYFDGNEPFLFTSVPKHMNWITRVTGLSSQKDGKKNQTKSQ